MKEGTGAHLTVFALEASFDSARSEQGQVEGHRNGVGR